MIEIKLYKAEKPLQQENTKGFHINVNSDGIVSFMGNFIYEVEDNINVTKIGLAYYYYHYLQNVDIVFYNLYDELHFDTYMTYNENNETTGLIDEYVYNL